MVLPLPLPTAAGPGCPTAHGKRSSARHRTDTEQGKAENLLQRGNWGHYSAGSRCKRSPRTQTPTIKTQSQHRSGSSGCTVTNPPGTRGSEQDGARTGTPPVSNHRQHAREEERQGRRARSDTAPRPSHPIPCISSPPPGAAGHL